MVTKRVVLQDKSGNDVMPVTTARNVYINNDITLADAVKIHDGDIGVGLDILGAYESLSALTTAVTSPAGGDIYQVGTSDNDKTLYLYSGGEWKDIGSYQGEKGEAGKTPVKGVDYFTDSEVEEILKSAAASVKVDSELSDESENAIQNKAVAAALKLNQDEIDELKEDIGNLSPYDFEYAKSNVLYKQNRLEFVAEKSGSWQGKVSIRFNVNYKDALHFLCSDIKVADQTGYIHIYQYDGTDKLLLDVYSAIDLFSDPKSYYVVQSSDSVSYVIIDLWLGRSNVVAGETYYINDLRIVKDSDTITFSYDEHFKVTDENLNADTIVVNKNDIERLKKGYDSIYRYSKFENGSLSNGVINRNIKYRVATDETIIFDRDITIYTENGYKAGYHIFDLDGGFIKDSGWRESKWPYTIKANTPFKMVISTDPEVQNPANVVDFCNKVYFKAKIVEDIENKIRNGLGEYFYTGEEINFKPKRYNAVYQYTLPKDTIENVVDSVSCQGCELYNDILFVHHANNYLVLHDITNGDVISQYEATTGHGDCCQFSDEFYDSTDEFPLLYSTADTNPAVVYVNRITRNNATLVRTLKFPLENTGYYAGHCLDNNRKIIYQIGYKENSYSDDLDGKNYMIISSWDLSELKNNEDGTYTPKLIETFNIPFIDCVQGQRMFDGKILMVSSNPLHLATNFYWLSVPDKRIVSTFPKESMPPFFATNEVEDCVITLDGEKYAMYAILSGSQVYKITF